jgi:hypothetical protein
MGRRGGTRWNFRHKQGVNQGVTVGYGKASDFFEDAVGSCYTRVAPSDFFLGGRSVGG